VRRRKHRMAPLPGAGLLIEAEMNSVVDPRVVDVVGEIPECGGVERHLRNGRMRECERVIALFKSCSADDCPRRGTSGSNRSSRRCLAALAAGADSLRRVASTPGRFRHYALLATWPTGVPG
jgi:hypothetical protein